MESDSSFSVSSYSDSESYGSSYSYGAYSYGSSYSSSVSESFGSSVSTAFANAQSAFSSYASPSFSPFSSDPGGYATSFSAPALTDDSAASPFVASPFTSSPFTTSAFTASPYAFDSGSAPSTPSPFLTSDAGQPAPVTPPPALSAFEVSVDIGQPVSDAPPLGSEPAAAPAPALYEAPDVAPVAAPAPIPVAAPAFVSGPEEAPAPVAAAPAPEAAPSPQPAPAPLATTGDIADWFAPPLSSEPAAAPAPAPYEAPDLAPVAAPAPVPVSAPAVEAAPEEAPAPVASAPAPEVAPSPQPAPLGTTGDIADWSVPPQSNTSQSVPELINDWGTYAPEAAASTVTSDSDVPVAIPAGAPAVNEEASAPGETPPAEPETGAVTRPVAPQPELETRPLAPLPPEKQTTVAKPGDTLWKYANGDVAAIGDMAVRNGLKNSQIIAGKTYDTTPMDRDNLSASDIALREQIGQAYLNQDNARLAALAETARVQELARETARFTQQQAANKPSINPADYPFGSGTPMPGSFMAGANANDWRTGSEAFPAAPAAPAAQPKTSLPKTFLSTEASNTFSQLAQSPGVLLGRTAVNTFGYNDMPANARGAGETGFAPGMTQYNAGDVSILGINNYSVTSINDMAIGGSFRAIATDGPNGLDGSIVANGKAQSLLTDTMFETLPNGVGKPDETMRAEFAAKFLVEAMPVKEFKTDGVYADLNKKTVTVSLGSLTFGAGGSLEVANPFDPARKIGFEGSAIVDLNLVESKQMSAAGSVANPQTGIYGAAFGYETRNRLASGSLTLNGGADIGIARGKLTGQVFTSAGAFGGGGTASWAWNDKEGSLTLQGTSSFLAGIGGGYDLSGKVQADWAKDLVKNTGQAVDTAKDKGKSLYDTYVQPVLDKKWSVSDFVHGALTAGSFAPSFIGSGVSLVEAGLYAFEGNKTEAGISLAAAGLGVVSQAGAAKLALKGSIAMVDAAKIAKLEAHAGPDAAKAATEVFEMFSKDYAQNGLTIGSRTALVDASNKGNAIIIQGVSEAEVIGKFLELTGTKTLPVGVPFVTKGNAGVRYIVEAGEGSFTLRNASSSQMPGGLGGWTINVPNYLGPVKGAAEIKFPTPPPPKP